MGSCTVKKGYRFSRPQPGSHYQTLSGREFGLVRLPGWGRENQLPFFRVWWYCLAKYLPQYKSVSAWWLTWSTSCVNRWRKWTVNSDQRLKEQFQQLCLTLPTEYDLHCIPWFWRCYPSGGECLTEIQYRACWKNETQRVTQKSFFKPTFIKAVLQLESHCNYLFLLLTDRQRHGKQQKNKFKLVTVHF